MRVWSAFTLGFGRLRGCDPAGHNARAASMIRPGWPSSRSANNVIVPSSVSTSTVAVLVCAVLKRPTWVAATKRSGGMGWQRFGSIRTSAPSAPTKMPWRSAPRARSADAPIVRTSRRRRTTGVIQSARPIPAVSRKGAHPSASGRRRAAIIRKKALTAPMGSVAARSMSASRVTSIVRGTSTTSGGSATAPSIQRR